MSAEEHATSRPCIPSVSSSSSYAMSTSIQAVFSKSITGYKTRYSYSIIRLFEFFAVANQSHDFQPQIDFSIPDWLVLGLSLPRPEDIADQGRQRAEPRASFGS